MKTTLLSCAAALLLLNWPAYGQSQRGVLRPARDAQIEILERGPHHEVVRLPLERPGDKNLPPHVPPLREEERFSTYTVLETGRNYYSEEEARWKPSEEVIEIIDGVGVAQRGQQKVIFSPNLNTQGSIDLETPDGKRLRATPLALVYFDALTGAQVTLGVVKDSIGTVLPPNRIIYKNAFENLKADVVYT